MMGRLSLIKNDRLSVERARQIFDYCPLTGRIWWKHRPELSPSWNKRYAGKTAGTIKKGYVQIVLTVDGKHCYFSGQRLIWALFYGEWPEGEVDHEDHDTLNNRLSNLREASHSQNGANKNELRGKVPFKGVYYMPSKGRYAAQIKFDGRWKWLGLHVRAEDAAMAYDLAAVRFQGEFAKTNAQMGLL